MSAPVDIPFEVVGGKAATTELEDGALLIRGIAANFDRDREDEAFAPSAFGRGLAKFLAGNAPLCHHHDYKAVIGRVLKAERVQGKGLVIEAVVDPQPKASPHRWIYDGVKRGRINSLSFGGIFRRAVIDGLMRIVDADFLELSVTAVPTGKGTTFEVVANAALTVPEGKAISATGEVIDRGAAARLLAEAQQLKTEVQQAMWRNARGITFASNRSRDTLAEIEQDRGRSGERRDHVETENVELSRADALALFGGGLPRDRTGAVDERRALDGWTADQLAADDDGPSTLSASDHAALYGIDSVPVMDPGPTPEAVFRRQAEDSRLDKLRDAFRKLDGGDQS